MENINSPSLELAIREGDAQRTVVNPVRDARKTALYISAIEKAMSLFVPDNGTLIYDAPEAKYSYHSLTIKLIRDEYEDDEIRSFAEIINVFDSMMIYSDTQCNVSIQLIIHGIYTEREPE